MAASSRLMLKEDFEKVFDMERRILLIEERIEILRAKQETSGFALSLDGGVSKTRGVRRAENLAVEILEMEEEMTKTKIALLTTERRIKDLVGTLENPIQRAIIIWRYICRYVWREIAERAEMSEMNVIREINKAFSRLEDKNREAGGKVAQAAKNPA